MLQLIGICTDTDFYISKDIHGTYDNTRLSELLFDGEKAKNTFHNAWLKINKKPEKITKPDSKVKRNKRYELKPEFHNTLPENIFPKVIQDNEDIDYKFYEYKYDIVEVKGEEIEFNLTMIAHVPLFEDAHTHYKYQVNIIDKITNPDILYPFKKCRIPSENSYEFIKMHVMSYLDKNIARFVDCGAYFIIEKFIPLPAPVEVKCYTLAEIGKKHPKYRTEFKSRDSFTVFKLKFNINGKPSTDVDQKDIYWNTAPNFEGENLQDVKNQIDEYLKELMTFLNTPLEYCPHCKGRGVIDVPKFEPTT